MSSVKRSSVAALITSTRDGFAYAEDGERLAVVRPKRPEVAIAIAHIAMHKQDGSVLEELPGEDYTFAGWLSADGKHLLDTEGKTVGEPQRGDSLITFKNATN